METGGHPDCGVCAAVDVHYLSTGGARAAAVLAAGAAFAHVRAERAAVVPRVPPCRPGESCRRELPLVAVSKAGERRVVTGWSVPVPGPGVPGHPADLLVRGGTSIPVASLAGFEVVVLNGFALLRIPT